MSARAAAVAEAILEAVAGRLRLIALDDPALVSLTIVINLGSGGGHSRSIAVRPEYRDELSNGVGYVDSCGPLTGPRR